MRSGFDVALVLLVAAPWAAGLVMLVVRRAFGIALLQANATLCGLFLLYPAFLSIFFIDGTLRSWSVVLALAGCVLILAATLVWRREIATATLPLAWGVPLLFMGAAYGLVQLHAKLEDRKVLGQMDLKTGDEAVRLGNCLARFSAANAQRYPANDDALKKHCAKEAQLSYYRIEYLTAAGDAAGAVDYSICLVPVPGASPERSPAQWILGPTGLAVAHDYPSITPSVACGHTSSSATDWIPRVAHQCLLRRQMRGDRAVPTLEDIAPWGDRCLTFDTPDLIKWSAAQLTTPAGRFLLLAPPPGSAWYPRFVHCDRAPGNPPRLWTSRAGYEPAPPELAKLCDS